MNQGDDLLRAILVSASVAPVLLAASSSNAFAYRAHEDHVLGTSLDVVAVADGPGSAAMAIAALRSEIRRLDRCLSGFDPESELSRLNRTARPLRVSSDLFAVLRAAEEWRVTTDSAFSGRMGRVQDTWRDPAVRPNGADILMHAQAAEAARVVLDVKSRTVMHDARVAFALDGLAKGYILDAALKAAKGAAPGLAGILIDIGGDIRCWGCAPGGRAWRIGVAGADLTDNALPPVFLQLAEGAVASSGRGARDIIVDGEARTHILAPRTGQFVQDIERATVVAPQAMTADALATAFVAMEPRRSIAFADAMPGVEAALVLSDGSTRVSQGWAGLITSDTIKIASPVPLRLAQAAAAAEPAWPTGFVAAVNYEVPRLESDNYKSPYITIWVTDEKRNLVRTLLVLGNEGRYIDSNFVWWRRYGRKDTARVDAVARPTRAPGRYAVTWDGRDDAGRAVPQGRYMLHMEATREHGGHTYESADFTVGAQPSEFSLQGRDELGPLHLRYGPGS